MNLVYREGDGTSTFSLTDRPKATIGRASDCSLVLTDRSVSRHHATIEIISGQYLIQDGNSSNGTFLNGMRLNSHSQVALREGDVLEIGAVRFICGSPERLAGSPALGARELISDVAYPLADLLKDGQAKAGVEVPELGARFLRAFVGVSRTAGLERSLDVVVERVGVESVALFLKEGRSLKLVAGRPKQEAVRLLGDVARRSWERQEGRVVRGVVSIELEESRDTVVQPLYSSAAVPIVIDAPLGVIAVERVQEHGLDRGDLALLALLGELIVQTLLLGSENPNDTKFGFAKHESSVP